MAQREQRVGAVELPAIHRARALEVGAIGFDRLGGGLRETTQGDRRRRAGDVEQLAGERVEQRPRIGGAVAALLRLMQLPSARDVEQSRRDDERVARRGHLPHHHGPDPRPARHLARLGETDAARRVEPRLAQQVEAALVAHDAEVRPLREVEREHAGAALAQPRELLAAAEDLERRDVERLARIDAARRAIGTHPQ